MNDYLDQGKTWKMRSTGEALNIKDMTRLHRTNAARTLLNSAAMFLDPARTLTEPMSVDEAQSLIKETVLYRALTDESGNPDHRAASGGLAWRTKDGYQTMVADMTSKQAAKKLAKLTSEPQTEDGQHLVEVLTFQAADDSQRFSRAIADTLLEDGLHSGHTVIVEQAVTGTGIGFKLTVFGDDDEEVLDFNVSGKTPLEFVAAILAAANDL